MAGADHISRWLDMFETLCARYYCRSVESLAAISLDRMNYNEVFFIGGPSAKWLAEITSVVLTRRRRNNDTTTMTSSSSSSAICLVESSAAAVRELVNQHERRETRDRTVSRYNDEIVLDWFAVRSTGVVPSLNFTTTEEDTDAAAAGRCEERRQCILRVDRNNAIITVLLLTNTTNLQELSPISISCNPSIDRCLRPFLFIFACELAIREVSYENLSLHRDAFPSSTCWLTKAREMYKRTKWLRVTKYKNDAELRDSIMCQRINTTNIRLLWRDGYVFRASSSSLFSGKSAHLLPISAVIDLSAIYRDVKYNERSVLSLCDFGVFCRRCEKHFASNWSIPLRAASMRCNSKMAAAAMSYELAAVAATTTEPNDDEDENDKRLRKRRDANGYESRYFVNANNELISRRFVQLS